MRYDKDERRLRRLDFFIQYMGLARSRTKIFYSQAAPPPVMLLSTRPICASCRSSILSLFRDGFAGSSRTIPLSRPNKVPLRTLLAVQRGFHGSNKSVQLREGARAVIEEHGDLTSGETLVEVEGIVRSARQAFGETLPKDFLSPQELDVYERLYGLPLGETQPGDVDRPQPELANEEGDARNILLQENAAGELEEVQYMETTMAERNTSKLAVAESASKFEKRMLLYHDTAIVRALPHEQEGASHLAGVKEARLSDLEATSDSTEVRDYEDQEDFEESEDDLDNSAPLRTHPLTTAGRFSTSPATLHLPRHTLVEPVNAMLASFSKKHLTDVAYRVFGGPGLPNSTATPSSKGHLQQQPVALEATQANMSEMEADVYLAAIMPGAYSAVMSTLIEIRKRLGSQWLQELLEKPGGPRILDAGAGGAGILAWQEIIRAEWETLHPKGLLEDAQIPVGKSTVITGSSELRHRASRLLINTTFLPRLPDYQPAQIKPERECSPKKQYDVVLAPHTLWTLKEDHMRKAQVQNYWSLLNPKGGVLVIIEKGVPRGFELVAGARETLLKHRISSPHDSEIKNRLESLAKGRFLTKENGMIIAPCTNHAQCPMYMVPGASKGRKDHCHFSQRFIRPPYLQHILGAKERNHEDVRFSYIAVQRGRDQRQIEGIEQSDATTMAAFAGYQDHNDTVETPSSYSLGEKSDLVRPHMLSLPRTIMPPMKRHGHVTLDLCTPSGQLERWTVPKSFSKQAYRDARKSKWGDLWALGAKTRVLRQARVGSPKDELKAKRVLHVGVGTNACQDSVREVLNRSGHYKRHTVRDKKGIKSKDLEDEGI